MRTITQRADFDRAFSSGRRAGGPLVRIIVSPSTVAEGQVAFVCAKRLGKAVFRNRSKRVLRACAREVGLPLAGKDVVLLATPRTAHAPHGEVVDGLRQALRRVRGR